MAEPNPNIQRQVLTRMVGAERAEAAMAALHPPVQGPAEKPDECRTPGCHFRGDGLDGFCVPCSRERERQGKWHTPPLDGGGNPSDN